MRRLFLEAMLVLAGARVSKQTRPIAKVTVLGFVVLTLAFTLPTTVFGDKTFEDSRYAVYDHQTRSHLPIYPECGNSTDPECDTTRLVTWKFGPIRLNNANHPKGDAVHYQLQETYRIDLGRYINSDSMGKFVWCKPRHQRKWWEMFHEGLGGNVDDDHEISLDNLVLTIKRGYRWDGPSIEFFDWRFAAKPYSLMRPSLVHDALYDFPRRRLVERDYFSNTNENHKGFQFRLMADCMLAALSLQDGTKLSTVRSDVGVVRFGGAPYTAKAQPFWKDHATADAGPDQEITCALPDGAYVELDGSASTFGKEPESKEPYYQWEWGQIRAYGERPSLHFYPGTHTITLIVDDGDDFEKGPFGDSDQVTVTVKRDTVAPVIMMLSGPRVLWPPNRKFETLHVRDFVAGVCEDCVELSADDVAITHVRSNEWVQPGAVRIAGDGGSVKLRRWRSPRGDGRVYTIFVEVMDEAGNRGTGSYEVQVPRSCRDCRR